jgi:type I restriction enzyme S subunit
MKQQTQTNKIEWKEIELEEIIEIIAGQAPPSSSYNHQSRGLPFIRVNSFRTFYPEAEEFTDKSLKECERGDILLSVAGTIGSINFADKKYSITRSIFAIRSKNKDLDIMYLFYYLKTLKQIMKSLGTGSSQKIITIPSVKKLKIPLPFSNNKPDLKEQERIVKILEKAEKLKERGKNADDLLDEYLKSIFNEMFYDKGFVLKRGKELFELAYGKGLSGEQRDGGKYPVYGSNGIVGSHSEFLVEGPGIIVGRKGSIGEVNYSTKNFWAIDTTYYVKPLKETNFIYLYYLLKSHNLKLNNSTAIPGLNRNDVYIINFVDPPLPLQQKFAKIVEQIEKMKENVKKTKQNSEELFNSLMSKAFKGGL